MGPEFTIGHLAKESGVKVQTVRYYEQIGLMPEPYRSEGNQRLYASEHVDRLAFIRHARDLGFPLAAIRELLELHDRPDRPCEEADEIAKRHLIEVETKLEMLMAMKSELSRMVYECAGGQVSQCRVIEILSDHGQCLNEDHRKPNQ